MIDPIEFTTERLQLRQWRPADREPFARLNADPRVMEFFPAPLDRAASDARADRIEAQIAERGWGLWAVATRTDDAFIGFVGLQISPADLPCSPSVEIGWRLACEHWGQGYAPEAARGALRIGFANVGLAEIVSFTAVRNHNSRRVMEKLGMREDPQTFAHPLVPEGSPLREHCLYRLSRDQWSASLPILPRSEK
jgi:RimJ/RimL family protein N-acetyltransferase